MPEQNLGGAKIGVRVVVEKEKHESFLRALGMGNNPCLQGFDVAANILLPFGAINLLARMRGKSGNCRASL